MARPLTFQQIEAFRAVVLSGTTVAAARMLHTTQPTISRLIGQAQHASGLKLFTLDRGRLQLTREGRHLFDTVQQNFQGFERIERAVAALRASGAGVFRIACTPSLGQSILAATMQGFVRQFPQVHFTVQTLASMQIEEGLRQGLYDIALTNRHADGAEFQMHVVHEAQAVCVCAAGHPFSLRASVDITDLRDQTLLSLPPQDDLEVALRRAFGQKKIALPTVIETIYSATICSFVARGIGVAVINPYMASEFTDKLCIRRFSPKLPVTTYAAFSRFSPASELAEKFFEELKVICKGWGLPERDRPAVP